jgi:hypothetical protein
MPGNPLEIQESLFRRSGVWVLWQRIAAVRGLLWRFPACAHGGRFAG